MTPLPAFANEPVLELRRAPVRAGLADALRAHDARGALDVPVWVGEDTRTGDALVSTDPGAPDRVVARAAAASQDDVDAALEAARSGQREWARRPAAERAAVLARAAAWLREHRLEVAALEVRECAKPWPEADADVCEAIDFLEYYARGAVELEAGAELLQMPGERNTLSYRPRGVVAVISPWNFPVAIPCGMVAAGLATGNAVVLKPAEQAPGCAFVLVRALREAGVPADALALLPGRGRGRRRARARPARAHDRVHRLVPGRAGDPAQRGRDARRAEAPQARHRRDGRQELRDRRCRRRSRRGRARARAVGVRLRRPEVLGRRARALPRGRPRRPASSAWPGAVEVLAVGQAERLDIDVPPVIERERPGARRPLRRRGGADRPARGGRQRTCPQAGWFATPAVAAELPPDSPVLHEEIFGPLLAVERVRDVAEACDRVDASPFGLTGGLFARNPDTVDYVVDRSPVGNLYVNRAITGAMVARQPFGGNRLSGTGSKAGGPGYLLQFADPRVVTENTMRHGLVV